MRTQQLESLVFHITTENPGPATWICTSQCWNAKLGEKSILVLISMQVGHCVRKPVFFLQSLAKFCHIIATILQRYFSGFPYQDPSLQEHSKDAFEIAMIIWADTEGTNKKKMLTAHQDQTALKPGILKELKHEISELLTQQYVTSQLKVSW